MAPTMTVRRFFLTIVVTFGALLALTAAIAWILGSTALGLTFLVAAQTALTIAVVRMVRNRDGGAPIDEIDIALITCFFFGTIVFFTWLAVTTETFWIALIPAVPLAFSATKYLDLRNGRAGAD